MQERAIDKQSTAGMKKGKEQEERTHWTWHVGIVLVRYSECKQGRKRSGRVT